MEFRTIIKVEFKEFDRTTLEKSREWLMDPQIKELTITPTFERSAQEKWFIGLKDRDDYYIRSVWRDKVPIGVFGLKNITDYDGEIWGYIGEKKYWGKAIGFDMMVYIIEYAASHNLKSIYSIFLKSNLNSYKICRRFGFEVEKNIDNDKIQMRYIINKTMDQSVF